MMKIIIVLLVFMNTLDAFDISKKYPSFNYVFNEFDVDKSYIYDDAFIAFVKKNQRSLRKFYKRSLLRGEEILPTMKGLLSGEGVSDLFIYLSMIESGFSSTAISSKKAVGLWQFMPETAKHYNLNVSKEYDERYDTIMATSAAIRYLNKLHDKFDKWYLAAMAFNCGEGCLEKAIKRAGTNDIFTLTNDTYKYLPKETRDYIRKILLIAMIGESNIFDSSKNSECVKVEVDAGTDLKYLAKVLKMKYSTLKKLNLAIKNTHVPNKKKKYNIFIPINKVYTFYLQYELEDKKNQTKPYFLSHYVSLGETIESIAKKYNTDSFDILIANNLKNDYLTLNQFLIIPVDKRTFEKNM